ncbi:MAG: nickel ABC transporter permease [Eubacteriales bacterium]
MIKRYFLRIVNVVIVLIGITFLSFSLLYLAPGDPAETYIRGGDGNAGTVSEEAIQAQREKWGLDKPFFVQYFNWLGNILRGNFGESYTTNRPVLEEIGSKIGPTLILSVAALFVTLLISIPLGVLCALYKDRLLDNICRVFSFIGIAVPSFLSSLLLLYFFAIQLNWLPVVSKGGFQGLILPVTVLTIQCSAKFIRQVRSIVLEQMNQEYVRGAIARGVTKSKILFSHVLRNAWLPIITLIGIYFGVFLSGAAIVETIFSWQGIGQLAVEAVGRKDYPVIQAIILWLGVLYVAVNFLVDLSYSLLDPRVRLGKGENK